MRLEMADLIEAAQKLHATVSNSANISLQPLAESSSIPPAAPRVLLVTLVLNKPELVSVLSEDMEGGLQHLIASPRKRKVLQQISNGAPNMLFVCHHKTTSLSPFFIGGNEANWRDLPAIAVIRHEDRDHRLRPYIPFCQETYQALRAMEDAVLQQRLLDHGVTKLDQARMEAIEKMRKDHRFLGRTSEVGQAFDGNHLKAHQCCYICQGIMGYLTPAQFKPVKKGHI